MNGPEGKEGSGEGVGRAARGMKSDRLIENILAAPTRKLMIDLEADAAKLTDVLKGKTVKLVKRHRFSELMIEFEDGARLFVNRNSDGLDFCDRVTMFSNGTSVCGDFGRWIVFESRANSES
jgi:hypothetical protein